jgi:hypothetical protein
MSELPLAGNKRPLEHELHVPEKRARQSLEDMEEELEEDIEEEEEVREDVQEELEEEEEEEEVELARMPTKPVLVQVQQQVKEEIPQTRRMSVVRSTRANSNKDASKYSHLIVAYQPGCGMPELKGEVGKEIEIRVAAKYLSTKNKEVTTRQIWGTDLYTDDSDVVASKTCRV